MKCTLSIGICHWFLTGFAAGGCVLIHTHHDYLPSYIIHISSFPSLITCAVNHPLHRLPRELRSRIWDLLLSDGVKALHRIGLALLYLSRPILLKRTFVDIFMYLKELPLTKTLEPDLLIATALNFKVTNSMLARLSGHRDRSLDEGLISNGIGQPQL